MTSPAQEESDNEVIVTAMTAINLSGVVILGLFLHSSMGVVILSLRHRLFRCRLWFCVALGPKWPQATRITDVSSNTVTNLLY